MRNTINRVFFPVFVLLVSALTFPGHAAEINVAAANSTCNTIKAVGARYLETHDVQIHYLCKSSGRLAKGLRGGAIHADIYISANRHWMEYMINGGLVSADTVISPWGNRLVVSAPDDSPLEIQAWNDLTSDRIESVLIGDPGTAPFGRYAKQALQRTGIWEQVKHKITTTRHISLLAERLARSNERTVGIMFSTNVTERLRPILAVDPHWHPTIRYYMAPLTTPANGTAVSEFFAFINSRDGREIFRSAGFDVSR